MIVMIIPSKTGGFGTDPPENKPNGKCRTIDLAVGR